MRMFAKDIGTVSETSVPRLEGTARRHE